jgi:S1-C subfamily serine protease
MTFVNVFVSLWLFIFIKNRPMKKFLPLFLIAILTLNSCATILNGKRQKVQIKTKDKASVVYVDGKEKSKGRTVTTELARDAAIKQIRIETEGYKDQYIVHYQNKKSPLYILSWIPFGVLFYPPFMDLGPKSFNYEKSVMVREKLIPISEKSEDEKYVFVKNTEFDIDEEDFKVRRISHKNLKKNKKSKFKDIVSNEEELKFDNSVFTDALNQVLINYKYMDTTSTIFKNKNNTAYLSAKIKGLDLQYVYAYASRTYKTFLRSEVQIEWEMLDVYGQSKFKKTYKSESGEFAPAYFEDETMLRSVKDAIEASFMKFIQEKKSKDFLKIDTTVSEPVLALIPLDKGVEIKNIGEALEATVTIKSEDQHGSGFAISKDGYIVTNFHVVAGKEEDLTVIDKSGKEFKAAFIRKNENLDLALIKVEKEFSYHFYLPVNQQYSVGQDIFAIGTPRTIELGQSLTKGIISGDREKGDVKYIQTDASINGGNSGGPLTDKEGKILGVVNAKLSGIGVEGLGFAIPAERVASGLYVE